MAVLNNGDSPLELASLSAGTGGVPLRGTFAPGAELTEVTGRAHNLSITSTGLLVGTVPPRTLLAVAGTPGEDEETGTASVTLVVDARSQGEAGGNAALELRRFDTGSEQRIPMTPVAGQAGFWEVTLDGLERFRSLSFKFGNAAPGAKNGGYEGPGQSDRSLYLDNTTLRFEGVYNFISVPAPDAAIEGTLTALGAPLTGALVEADEDPALYHAFPFADGSYYLPFPAGSSTDLTATAQGGAEETRAGVTAPATGVDFAFGGASAPKYIVDGDLADWNPRTTLVNGPNGFDGGFGPDNLFTELLVDWDETYLYLGYRYHSSRNSALVHLGTRPGGSSTAERFDAWPRLVSFADPIDFFVAQYQGEPLELREVISETQTAERTEGVLSATVGSSPAYTSEVAVAWSTLGFGTRPDTTLNLYAGIYGGDGYGAGDILPNETSTPNVSGNTVASFDASRRVDFQTPFSVNVTD